MILINVFTPTNMKMYKAAYLSIENATMVTIEAYVTSSQTTVAKLQPTSPSGQGYTV